MKRSQATYLSPGVFDLGGIARYGRYQVKALRELLGKVEVLSMLGPEENGFDEAFAVDFAARGNRLRHKMHFAMKTLQKIGPRTNYWAGHLNYAALALACASVGRGDAIVNIYGLEVWSAPRRSSCWALKRAWVVSDCQATLDYAIEAGMVDPSRAAVIRDPVDLERFSPGRCDPDLAAKYGMKADGVFRVMFLGRMGAADAYKQPDMLIRAFARAKLPESAELVVAGSGERLPELKRLAESSGAGGKIRFLGRIPDAELPGLYRLASLFVLVSRRGPNEGEGIPLTPLEASACGVPIVVGNEDGSREAPVHDETGFIIGSRDEDALVAILESCSRNEQLLERMREASARRARECFSYQRFVSDHRKFLAMVGVEGQSARG